MVTASFERDKGPTLELEKSIDLVAVRTRSRRSLRAAPVQRRAVAEIADGKLVFALPEAGVEVYRVPVDPKHRSVEERKSALRKDADVQFAGGVLVDQAGEPVLYTENVFIKFKDDADPDACEVVLRQAGLTVKRRIDYATNAFFAGAPEGTGERVFAIANELLRRDDVEYCHPELVQRRERRGVFAQQWHLHATVVNGVPINAHANVVAAHGLTRGEGVVIAVIDDGVDIDHPELRGPGKLVAPRDATFPLGHPLALDPRPKDLDFVENHGTACAGVACASGIDGASGVAPAARLMPIRLGAGLGSQQEADAFKWAADNGADVISCSWGPPDGRWWDETDPKHRRVVPLPPSTKLALDHITRHGRGGKGCVVLFAAGNGNERVENDGYASYEKVTAVAACNDRGKRSVYSDFGAAVWCAFPSDDSGWPEKGRPEPLTSGIWTTDRMSLLGYNPGVPVKGDTDGNYTNNFGGTSSACPGAAGVAALVLSANPELKWNEVKDVLGKACDVIDPQGGAYDPVTARSPFYGFGRLNAETAVKLARANPQPNVRVSKIFNQPIPDLNRVEVSLEVAEAAVVEKVAVEVDLRHTYIGDLVVTLVPPAGRGLLDVRLRQRAGGATRDLKQIYDASTTPELGAYAGVACNGTWKLRVEDQAAEDSGVLSSFGLTLTLMDRAPATAPAPRRAAALFAEASPGK